MQMNPYVGELSLYDIAGTPGVAADVSHINQKAVVKVTFSQNLGDFCILFCFIMFIYKHMGQPQTEGRAWQPGKYKPPLLLQRSAQQTRFQQSMVLHLKKHRLYLLNLHVGACA